MKKFSISSICLVLLLCVTMLSGCLKADSATLIDNIAKFKNDLSPLKQSTESYGSGLLDNGYNFKFISNEDNLNLQRFIYDASLPYNLLCEGEEYDFILTNASTYFINKFSDGVLTVYEENLSNVPQSLNTQLYYNIEAVTSALKSFKEAYANLSFTTEQSSNNPTSMANIKNLNTLLNEYDNVIGKILTMNITAQQIYDYHLIKVDENFYNLTAIPDFEVKRLVETYSLYITNYLYQKHMVFNDVYNSEQVINKFETDSLYVSFKNLLNKLNQVVSADNINVNNTDARHVEVYKYLRECENNLLNDVELNNYALNVLQSKVPSESDSQNYLIYNNFYNNYEDTLTHYIQLLTELLS